MPFQSSSEYYQEVMAVLEAGWASKTATFLWGDPGTGKTSLLNELAEIHDLNFESVSAPQLGIDGAVGLPYALEDNLGTDTDTPAWAKRVIDHNRKTGQDSVVLFSEFSNVHRSVQAPYLNILLERRFANGQRLPEGTWLVADGNGMDSAVDSEGLAAPTANRFLHIDWNPPLEDWLEGMSANWGNYDTSDREMSERMKVYAFIKAFGMSELHDIPKDTGEYRGFATRRSWDTACKILAKIDLPGARKMALNGLVGESHANQFVTFEAELALPDPEDVLNDPESIDWDGMGSDAAHIILRTVLTGVGRGNIEKSANIFRVIENTNRRDAGAANVKLFLSTCLANSDLKPVERIQIIKEVFMDSAYGAIVREAGLF